MLTDVDSVLVELEACIVGDAGEADERVWPAVAAASCAVSRMSPLTTRRFGIALRQEVVAEEHRVVDRDLVALIEQLGHQQAAAIARAARHENAIEESYPWQCPPDLRPQTSRD